MNLVLSSNTDFFLTNLWWIITLVVLFGFALYFLVAFLVSKKKEGEKPIEKSAYLTALGGEDNILSHKRIGSRIILCLKDYSLLDKEKLKEAGVIGFIQKSDQLTLVADSDSKKVYETLFNE